MCTDLGGVGVSGAQARRMPLQILYWPRRRLSVNHRKNEYVKMTDMADMPNPLYPQGRLRPWAIPRGARATKVARRGPPSKQGLGKWG